MNTKILHSIIYMFACLFILAESSHADLTARYTAEGESNLIGTRSGYPLPPETNGNYTDTHENDDRFEVIHETIGGWWIFKYSLLQNVWKFHVEGGETLTFFLRAHSDVSSADRTTEAEDFRFFYSVSGPDGNYVELTSCRIIQDSETSKSQVLSQVPAFYSGDIHIKVKDSNRTAGKTRMDSLFIDEMYIAETCSGNQALNPVPDDQAIVPLGTLLSWEPECPSSSHDIYFGDSPSNLEYRGNSVETSIDPGAFYPSGNLIPGKTYYWRIDEVYDPQTIQEGDVWSFFVQSVDNPKPCDTSTHTYKNATLRWNAVPDAETQAVYYRVYVGQTRNGVAQASPQDTDIYKGDETTTAYKADSPMSPGWYFWRIDGVDTMDQVDKGPVWSFYVPGLLKETPDGYEVVDSYPFDDPDHDPQPVGGGTGYTALVSPDGDAYLSHTLVYSPGCPVGNDDYTNPKQYCSEFDGTYAECLNDETIIGSRFMIVCDGDGNMLETALGNAAYGDVVYIDDFNPAGGQTEVDMTGKEDVSIPAGVTLASGRGKANGSEGALIVNNLWESPSGLFKITEPDVRITGLRFRGPAQQNPGRYSGSDITGGRGLWITNNTEVDNCELYHWSYTAIFLCNITLSEGGGVDGPGEPYIHHNYIHDPYRADENGNLLVGNALNYGVEVGKVYDISVIPKIEANIFDFHKHHITGIGYFSESGSNYNCNYEAAYNIFLENGVDGGGFPAAPVDMHGSADFLGALFWCSSVAGNYLSIHHNTFSHPSLGPGSTTPQVLIRGEPQTPSYIEYNWFFYDAISHAVKQKENSGNLLVQDNVLSRQDDYPNNPDGNVNDIPSQDDLNAVWDFDYYPRNYCDLF